MDNSAVNPKYTKVHNRFKLNGIHYSHDDLQEVAYSLVKEGNSYEAEIGNFLLHWLDPEDYIMALTSGSTGDPKPYKLGKQYMVNSAIATGDHFELEPGDKALLCLPARFIAGKMMLIRAIMLGLELDMVQPSSHVLIEAHKNYNFSAMLPLQLKHSMNVIQNIDTLIVGGAPVLQPQIDEIQNISTKVFESYGMTETITHIAVRPLNHCTEKEREYFEALTDVTLSQDKRGCLVIDAPHISEQIIITNDLVELKDDTHFKWLGRIDNVINSGGVKLFPEQIERKLGPLIKNRFFIASEMDETLGEKVILVIESEKKNFDPSILKKLDKFEKPKEVYFLPEFVNTDTGKLHRINTLGLLKN